MEINERKLKFTKCPACGSDQRFFETLANEAKAQNMGRPEWKMCMSLHQGVAVDPQKERKIPLGGKVPGYMVAIDLCMDCGCVYAIEASVHTVIKHLAANPVIPKLPLVGPAFNNPRVS